MNKYGLTDSLWNDAKEEARNILIGVARTKDGSITYSDLAARIRSISLEPRDPRLSDLLGEISCSEAAAGRGMLTVLVVHKQGDEKPGFGFFELAKSLGRDTSDEVKCWLDELRIVRQA